MHYPSWGYIRTITCYSAGVPTTVENEGKKHHCMHFLELVQS